MTPVLVKPLCLLLIQLFFHRKSSLRNEFLEIRICFHAVCYFVSTLLDVVVRIGLDKCSEFKPSKEKKTEWFGLLIKHAWLAAVFVLWAWSWWALDELCIF